MEWPTDPPLLRTASALQLSHASHSSHDYDVYGQSNIYLLTLVVNEWSVERKTGRAKANKIFAVCDNTYKSEASTVQTGMLFWLVSTDLE